MALTADEKKLVDKLMAEGKSCKEIKDQIGTVGYTAVWQYFYRDSINKEKRQKNADNQKHSNKLQSGKYVETGKQMPPTNPPRTMTMIVDKELAELACKQLGLKPPVTTLANRPRTFNSNGFYWKDGNWIPMQDSNNHGMVRCSNLLLRSRG